MSRIFVSYKRKDSRQVYSIIEEIKSKLGVDCWYDIDGIETQAQFVSKICYAIDQAEVVLFMHSKHHLDIDFEEDWTIKELNYATVKKKKIILVKLDDAPLENIFLFQYGSKNYITATDETQRDKLIKDLGRLLKITPNPLPTPEKVEPKFVIKLFRKLLPFLLLFLLVDLILFRLFVWEKTPKDVSFDETKIKHEWVDLGLSVKWATCNVGAKSPEEYGDYYAWGEIETKSIYYWSTYKYCNGSISKLTKYCNDSISGDNGFIDNISTLEMIDDVASLKWGGLWRIPTREEFRELLNNCTWTWTTLNGVIGYKITSNISGYTDRSIFLPAAGNSDGSRLDDVGSQGDYWSSSANSGNPHVVWSLEFNSDFQGTDYVYRFYGFTIRPVCP